jgi:hypothetical protein
MQRFTYRHAVRLTRLMDELLAALPALAPQDGEPQLRVEGTDETVTVEVPYTVARAAVDAVVAAHDASQPSAAEQFALADRAALTEFPTRTQLLTAIAEIDADLATLQTTPTLAGLTPIVRRTLQKQKAMIRALGALVRRAGS